MSPSVSAYSTPGIVYSANAATASASAPGDQLTPLTPAQTTVAPKSMGWLGLLAAVAVGYVLFSGNEESPRAGRRKARRGLAGPDDMNPDAAPVDDSSGGGSAADAGGEESPSLTGFGRRGTKRKKVHSKRHVAALDI